MATATETTSTGLQFDVDEHVYTLEGRRLPSVTGILDAMGLYHGKDYWTEESRERGRAIHKALYFLARGRLKIESLDPRIQPYVLAYLQFKQRSGFESIICEEPMASRLGYAGTPDDLGLYCGDETLIDFKSGETQPLYEVQLAAYDQLIREAGLAEPRRWMIVLLKRDGSFKIAKRSLTDARARTLWASALNLYQFKEMGR